MSTNETPADLSATAALARDAQVHEARVDAAVAQYLVLVEQGQVPEREQFLAAHAEIAEELAAFLGNQQRVQAVLGEVARDSALSPPVCLEGRSTWNNEGDLAASDQPTLPLSQSKAVTVRTTMTRFGDYEILGELARGGMGIVYKARHTKLNRVVALKMILGGQLAAADEIERFHTEAAAAAQLDHPGIVPVFEVGEHQGRHFYAMGLIDGPNLTARVASGPMPPREAAGLIKGVAEAVQFAHEHGVIHRDLKPSNILLDSQLRPRVADFGLAKRLDAAADVTRTGQIVGTPGYMAPEQTGEHTIPIGPAADVYGLGAILYYLLVGRPPFQAAHPIETLRQARERDPVPPRQLNAEVPPDLETIVLKCLAKSCQQRYPTAQALADELQRFLEGRPITARPISQTERAARWVRRNPVVSGTGSLAVILLIVTTVVSFVAYRREAKLALQLADERNTVKTALQSRTTALEQESAARLSAREDLFRALMSEARARLLSNEPGRRFKALEAISQAVTIRRTPELRNEAIAALSLVDAEFVRSLAGVPLDYLHFAFDRQFMHYLVFERDGPINLRRVSDGTIVGVIRLPVRTGRVTSARFSPDGQWLTISIDGASGVQSFVYCISQRVAEFEPVWHWTGQVHCFGVDSRRLLIRAADDSPLVWNDLAEGKPAGQIAMRPGPVSVGLSADGQRLSVNRRTSVEVVSVADGTVLQRWVAPHVLDVWPAAWSPDGRFLSAGADDFKVYVWDIAQERIHSVLAGHSVNGIRTAFSANGEFLVSNGWDGTVRLWNYQQGRPYLSWLGHFCAIDERAQYMATFNSHEDRIELWRVAGNAAFKTLYHPMIGNEIRGPRPGGPRGAGFSPDGRWIAAGSDDGIRVWNAATGAEQLRLAAPSCDEALFHPRDGSLITYSARGVQRWRISAESGPSISRGSEEGNANVFLLGAPEQIFPRSGAGEYNHMSLDAAGRRLVVCDGPQHQALVFDLIDGGDPVVLGPHRGIRWVNVSPDGRFAVTGQWGHGATRVWDIATGKMLKEWPVDSSLGRMSADSQSLAMLSFTTKQVQFWNVDDWSPGRKIEVRRPVVHFASFSGESGLMALSDLPGLRIFDSQTIEELAALRMPDGYENDQDSCFSPRGNLLAGFGASAALSTVHLWDLAAIRGALREFSLDWEPAQEFSLPVDTTSRLAPSPELSAWLAQIGNNSSEVAARCGQLTTAGRWEEAARAYEALFTLGQPADNMRRFERALLYAWLRDAGALQKFCAEQFQIDRQTFWPSRCAYLMAGTLEDWKPALQSIESAIAREPNEPFHWAELGAVHVRAGQFAEAEEALQRFLNPQINRHYHVYGWFWMSLACLGAGKPDEAGRWLDKGIAWLNAAEMGQPLDDGNGPSAGAWWFRLELKLLRREVEERLRTR